jgi:NADH dehydrogenase
VPTAKKPRVLILGAGFGGLTAARALGSSADVTLIDRHNFQTFLPLLYQVATAGLAADHVAHPIRGALRNRGVQFRMGSPLSVDHKNKSVKLDSSETLEFDHLVVALGSATADFGVTGVAEHALGMKSVHEAILIRAEVMRRFEDLCRFEDETKLSISVIGGGPTGVEMAGAIAELIRGPLKSDQANAAAHIQVSLIEAGPRLLPPFAPSLSARTKKDLEKLGVKVLLNTAVKAIEHRKIILKDDSVLNSEITIWAAGVKGSDAMAQLNLPTNGNRVAVEPTMQVKNYPNIWALGDIAGALGKDGRPLPMVAPVAIQQGKFIAKQIARLMANKSLTDFKYLDKGSMATIGRNKAVVQVKGLKISGPIAWLIWLWLHLFYLLGGRNKIGTMADWTWNYLTFDRGNRHIMDSY